MNEHFSADELIKHPSNRCVLINGHQTLADALEALKEQAGLPNWYLVVQLPGGQFLAGRFTDLRQWEKTQERGQVRTTPVQKLSGSPLQPVDVVGDDIDLDKTSQLVTAHPLHLVVVTWEGSDTFMGIVTEESIRLALGAGAPLHSQPRQKEAQPVETPPVESVSQISPSAAGETPPTGNVTKTTTAGSQLPRSLGKTREVSKKLTPHLGRVWKILLGFFGIFGLLFTIYFSYFPTLFPDLFKQMNRPKMTHEWNLAVATFGTAGKESLSSDTAITISQVFYNKLKTEMESLKNEASIDFELMEPGTTGVISGDTPEARAGAASSLAAEINADMIIYGTIEKTTEGLVLNPEFFINIKNFQEAAEMVGQHSLGSSISISEEGSNLSLNVELSNRSQIMAYVVKGLSYYFTNAYEKAYELFNAANSSTLWNISSGREVIYLFVGNAALKANMLDKAEAAYNDALLLDFEYARAIAGLGSVYRAASVTDSPSEISIPDTSKLDKALQYYNLAQAAKNQPSTADIPTKVAFGKGEVYWSQANAGLITFDKAIQQYQVVIEQYNNGKNARIQELASEAHARLGIINLNNNQPDTALQELTTARDLSSHPFRRGLYWRLLGIVYKSQGKTEDAATAFQSAIKQYEAALPLTSQDDLRAMYKSSIAACYKELNDPAKAIAILNEAISLLPIKSKDLGSYDNKLAELYLMQNKPEDAKTAYQDALQAYQNILKQSQRVEVQAYYWSAIAACSKNLGDKEGAVTALQKAIQLLPEGSPYLETYQKQLDQMK